MTVFKIPFEQKSLDNKPDKKYYADLAIKLLNYHKFIVGYTYDAYNLIQYDTSPLLPRMIQYEHGLAETNPPVGVGIVPDMLSVPELKDQFAKKYEEMYEAILVDRVEEENNTYCFKNYKKSYLHLLKLDFAKSVKYFISEEKCEGYLQESLEEWSKLRTTKETETFLNDLLNQEACLQNYIAEVDAVYLKDLYNVYRDLALHIRDTPVYKLLHNLCEVLEHKGYLSKRDQEINGKELRAIPSIVSSSVKNKYSI